MNWPNRLSLMRIASVPVITLLLSVNGAWTRYVALFLFIFASITDFVDGHLARKYGLVTNFGKFLDPVADKLMVAVALVLFVAVVAIIKATGIYPPGSYVRLANEEVAVVLRRGTHAVPAADGSEHGLVLDDAADLFGEGE